ncbi:MAG: PA14 domain-containing protein [Lentisphaeraceae bacterium]|nr:PA14 domain-containing protein [Lentisphaeraceae bacterium]
MKKLRLLSFLLTLISIHSSHAGGLNREIYTDLPGHDIASISSNPKFQVAPEVYDVVTIYESPKSYGDNYGTYIRGYITIPVTGDYTFYFSSDDKGELYLSSDENEVNKEKIASVSGWTSYRVYNKYESQKSKTFKLNAGQVLYTEAFAKEGGGGDHLTVAWSLNNGPIEVISGDHLTPYHNDFDGVQQQLSLAISTAEALYVSSADNVGTDLGQYTEASRIVFQDAISKAKETYETENLNTHKLFIKLKAIESEFSKFDGGLKPYKLHGKVFGSLPSWSSSWSPVNAFDGNVATSYQYIVPDNSFVGIDLGQGNQTSISAIRFFPRINQGKRMRYNKFQGSVDGVNYIDLYTIQESPDNKWHSVTIDDSTAYRYYRYYDVAGYNGWGNVAEIEFLSLQNQDLYMQNSDTLTFVASTTNQVITADSVKAEHGGLPAELITYKVLDLPQYGVLNLSGTALSVESVFTQKDIDDSLLTFTSDNSRKSSTFAVEVTSSIGGEIDRVVFDINIDSDGDGLTDLQEISLGTDYNSADTDNDGLTDFWEEDNGFDPLKNNIAAQVSAFSGENGLSASYVYGSFRQLSDFASKSPAKVEKVSAINFSGSNWESLSKSGVKDYVGAVFSGYLYVPLQGNYRFLLNSDDGSRLFVDGIQVLDNDGLHGPKGLENTINLSEGLHKIRCEYFERSGGQICMLQWQGPGRSVEVIPASFFFLSPGEHDDLLRSIDRDQDGLTDILEAEEGSDPLNPDSDGDKLLDGEEYHAMYNYKTNPLSIDTDGDTVSDYDEIFVFQSNPLIADFDGSILESIIIVPAETSSRLGQWQNDGKEVFAQDRRGALEYTVDVTIPGIYRFDVVGAQNTPNTSRPLFDLHLHIDDEFVERFEHSIADGEQKTYSFITPYLSVGSHKIRIFWNNVYKSTSLRVKSLELSRPGGPDVNENGNLDWVDNYIKTNYSLDAYSADSAISPAQIEGKGRYLYKINASFSDQLQRGTYNRWFANVTLEKDAPTEFRIDYEDGLQSVNGIVTWTQTNVLDEGELMIPVGSSMLLNAVIEDDLEGSSVIKINDGSTEEIFNADANSPVEFKFDTPGTYIIQADYTGSELKSATLTVNVVGVAEVEAPYVWRGKERSWSWPGLNSEIHLEATGMQFTPNGSGFLLKRKEILADVNIVARLGSGGTILKSLPTLGFWLRDAVEGYLTVVDTYEDGSKLTNSMALSHQIPEGMEIKVNTISGVTFLDGSRNIILTKDDFDELGQWTLELLKSIDRTGASCHWYKVYQNGILVGQQNK